MRSRVSLLTPVPLFSARDTAPFVTPARLATSLIVGRLRPVLPAVMWIEGSPPRARVREDRVSARGGNAGQGGWGEEAAEREWGGSGEAVRSEERRGGRGWGR